MKFGIKDATELKIYNSNSEELKDIRDIKPIKHVKFDEINQD